MLLNVIQNKRPSTRRGFHWSFVMNLSLSIFHISDRACGVRARGALYARCGDFDRNEKRKKKLIHCWSKNYRRRRKCRRKIFHRVMFVGNREKKVKPTPTLASSCFSKIKEEKKNCATKNKHKTVTGENGKSSSPFLEHVVKQHHDEDMAQPSSEHTLDKAPAHTPPTP